jgi:hypothetical protein
VLTCVALCGLAVAGGCTIGSPPPSETAPADDGTLFDPGSGSSCADAAARKSYIGCEFWPTVTANPVWSVFDYSMGNASPCRRERSGTAASA